MKAILWLTIFIVSALGSTRIALTVTNADALTVVDFPLNHSVTGRLVSQGENPSLGIAMSLTSD